MFCVRTSFTILFAELTSAMSNTILVLFLLMSISSALRLPVEGTEIIYKQNIEKKPLICIRDNYEKDTIWIHTSPKICKQSMTTVTNARFKTSLLSVMNCHVFGLNYFYHNRNGKDIHFILNENASLESKSSR